MTTLEKKENPSPRASAPGARDQAPTRSLGASYTQTNDICFCGIGGGRLVLCDKCFIWFHAECANADWNKLVKKDKVFCPVCEKGEPDLLTRRMLKRTLDARHKEVADLKFNERAKEHLDRHYNTLKQIVDEKGNFIVRLMGRSGSGKTRLFKALTSIQRGGKYDASSTFEVMSLCDYDEFEAPEPSFTINTFHFRASELDRLLNEAKETGDEDTFLTALKRKEESHIVHDVKAVNEYLEELGEFLPKLCPVESCEVMGKAGIPGLAVVDAVGLFDAQAPLAEALVPERFKNCDLFLVLVPLSRFAGEVVPLVRAAMAPTSVVNDLLDKLVVVVTKIDEEHYKDVTFRNKEIEKAKKEFAKQMKFLIKQTYGLSGNAVTDALVSIPQFFVSSKMFEEGEENHGIDQLRDFLVRNAERRGRLMRVQAQELSMLTQMRDILSIAPTQHLDFYVQTCEWMLTYSSDAVIKALDKAKIKTSYKSLTELISNSLYRQKKTLRKVIRECAKDSTKWGPETKLFLDTAADGWLSSISKFWLRHTKELSLIITRAERTTLLPLTAMLDELENFKESIRAVIHEQVALLTAKQFAQSEATGAGSMKNLAEHVIDQFQKKRLSANVHEAVKQKAFENAQRLKELLQEAKVAYDMVEKTVQEENVLMVAGMDARSRRAVDSLTKLVEKIQENKRVLHFSSSEPRFVASCLKKSCSKNGETSVCEWMTAIRLCNEENAFGPNLALFNATYANAPAVPSIPDEDPKVKFQLMALLQLFMVDTEVVHSANLFLLADLALELKMSAKQFEEEMDAAVKLHRKYFHGEVESRKKQPDDKTRPGRTKATKKSQTVSHIVLSDSDEEKTHAEDATLLLAITKRQPAKRKKLSEQAESSKKSKIMKPPKNAGKQRASPKEKLQAAEDEDVPLLQLQRKKSRQSRKKHDCNF